MTVTSGEYLFGKIKSKKYRRAAFPEGHEERIREIINESVRRNEPIHFIKLWGKGDHDTTELPESMALDFLFHCLKEVTNEYPPGVTLNIVFADTHVQFNERRNGDQYLESLRTLIDKKAAHLTNLKIKISKMSEVVPYKAPITSTLGEFKHAAETCEINTEYSNAVIPELLAQAKKHYQGKEPPELIAKAYLFMNLFERDNLSSVFPNHIFISYNNPKQHKMYPEPMFPMFSIAHGQTAKPWFIAPEALQAAVLTQKPLAGAISRNSNIQVA